MSDVERGEHGGWTFDAPSGTWRNEELSAQVLNAAMAEADLEELRTVYRRRFSTARCPEYGRALRTPYDAPEMGPLVRALASCLRRVPAWTLLPHLRRNDASRYRCSCGEEFPLPSSFGTVNPVARHRELNPEHTQSFVLRPGETVAFYGIGAPPAEPDSLRENLPIPEVA